MARDPDPIPPWAALDGDQLPAADDPVGAGDVRVDAALRWRLVLGKHGEDALPLESSAEDAAGGDPGDGQGQGDLADRVNEADQLDRTLEFIYDREFAKRSHRQAGSGEGHTGLSVPAWLSGVRRLFPKEAVEVLEGDALTRYGLHELVTDPDVLREAEPNPELLRAILTFKHKMGGEVLPVARQVVREVVAQLAEQLRTDCAPALQGTFEPDDRPPARTYRNVDWHRTIRRNLGRWDPEEERLGIDRIRYRHRQRGRGRWRIVFAVDQSGSMLDSVIHAAVMGAIFAALPGVTCHLVLWDHRVVDLTHLVDDPLEVLMQTQLGGGTQLLPALQHCAGLISEPDKTLLVVLSDWFLYGEGNACLELASDLHDAGVRCLGLCALDTDARPVYDEAFARKLAGVGWSVAALTPKKLAEHVARWMA